MNIIMTHAEHWTICCVHDMDICRVHQHDMDIILVPARENFFGAQLSDVA